MLTVLDGFLKTQFSCDFVSKTLVIRKITAIVEAVDDQIITTGFKSFDKAADC